MVFMWDWVDQWYDLWDNSVDWDADLLPFMEKPAEEMTLQTLYAYVGDINDKIRVINDLCKWKPYINDDQKLHTGQSDVISKVIQDYCETLKEECTGRVLDIDKEIELFQPKGNSPFSTLLVDCFVHVNVETEDSQPSVVQAIGKLKTINAHLAEFLWIVCLRIEGMWENEDQEIWVRHIENCIKRTIESSRSLFLSRMNQLLLSREQS